MMTLVMMGLTNFMTMMLNMISLPIYLLGVRLISALVCDDDDNDDKDDGDDENC